MFSNIELPLGYNIMTLEYVFERTWKEIAKKTNEKWQSRTNMALFWGGFLPECGNLERKVAAIIFLAVMVFLAVSLRAFWKTRSMMKRKKTKAMQTS